MYFSKDRKGQPLPMGDHKRFSTYGNYVIALVLIGTIFGIIYCFFLEGQTVPVLAILKAAFTLLVVFSLMLDFITKRIGAWKSHKMLAPLENLFQPIGKNPVKSTLFRIHLIGIRNQRTMKVDYDYSLFGSSLHIISRLNSVSDKTKLEDFISEYPRIRSEAVVYKDECVYIKSFPPFKAKPLSSNEWSGILQDVDAVMSRLEVPGTPKEDSRFGAGPSDKEIEKFIKDDKQKEKEAMRKALHSPLFNGVCLVLIAFFVFLYFFGKKFFPSYFDTYSWALAMAFLVLAVFAFRWSVRREYARIAYNLETFKSLNILQYIEEGGLSLVEDPLHLPKKSTSQFHHFFRGETQVTPFIGFTNVVWRNHPDEKLCVAFKAEVKISDFKIFKSDCAMGMKNADHFFLKTIDLNKKKASDLKGSYKAKLDDRFNFSKFHWHMFSHEDWLILQIQGADWFEDIEYEDYKKFIQEAGDFAKSFFNL
jgi:hypothetical protein